MKKCTCIISGFAQTTNYCPKHSGMSVLNLYRGWSLGAAIKDIWNSRIDRLKHNLYPDWIKKQFINLKENNMSDVFHQKYRELNDMEKRELENIKTIAEDLYKAIVHNTKVGVPDPEDHSNGREMSLAKTKLEEAVMWAVKGLTK